MLGKGEITQFTRSPSLSSRRSSRARIRSSARCSTPRTFVSKAYWIRVGNKYPNPVVGLEQAYQP